MLARKSVKQRLAPSSSIRHLMESFRLMCNDAIRIGLEKDASSLKRLSKLSYGALKDYDVSKLLQALRDIEGCWNPGSKEEVNQARVPDEETVSLEASARCPAMASRLRTARFSFLSAHHRFERIPLNAHTLAVISQPGVTVRSFTLTEQSLSLCIAKEVEEIEAQGAIGIDRNLRNVTAGNAERVIYYDVSKAVEIAENTRSIVRSFKRNDVRIRRELASKYGRRRQERIRQILNRVSKSIVTEARSEKRAIAFEDIRGIRKLYRKGNGQGRNFRGRMNSWSFSRAEETGGIQGCVGGRACHHALREGDERHHDGLSAMRGETPSGSPR